MRITTTALIMAGILSLPVMSSAADVPSRGMSQKAVKQSFGQPNEIVPGVGNPPISRWVYEGFTVYFEGNFALHAVQHQRPKPAPALAPAVTELPAIEETGAVAETAPVTETPAPAPTATTESAPAGAAARCAGICHWRHDLAVQGGAR